MTRQEIRERSQEYRKRRAVMLAEREAQQRQANEVRRQREEKFHESLPTPEEIAAACEQIQATWTDAERDARYWCVRTLGSIRDVQPYEFPRVRVGEVAA